MCGSIPRRGLRRLRPGAQVEPTRERSSERRLRLRPVAWGIRKIPQVGSVEIGADVEIGANSCVDRAALEVTRIGDGPRSTTRHDRAQLRRRTHGFICGQAGLAGSTIVGGPSGLAGQSASRATSVSGTA